MACRRLLNVVSYRPAPRKFADLAAIAERSRWVGKVSACVPGSKTPIIAACFLPVVNRIMSSRSAKRIYTTAALEYWLPRLNTDWEEQFSSELLQRGRELYRRGAIRQIEVTAGDAIVSGQIAGSEGYVVLEWSNGKTVKYRASSGDHGGTLAVAGLYEIEELVGDEASPLPGESRSATNGHGRASDEFRPSYPERPSRPMRLIFSADSRRLHFASFWVEPSNEGEQLRPAAGPQADSTEDLPPNEREKLIRLAKLAREAGFSFVPRNGSYQFDDLPRLPGFARQQLPRWRKFFDIVGDELLRSLESGMREARLVVNFFHNGAEHLKTDWQAWIGRQRLSDEQFCELTRQSAGYTLVEGLGVVHLPPRPREILQEWRHSLDQTGGAVPEYLACSLFAREEIAVTASPEVEDWWQSLLASPTSTVKTPAFLRSYQQHGVRWMHHLLQHGCHPLLADEMGLGKTLQVLSLIAASEETLPSLVVCPASVIPVWQGEARRFFPSFRTTVLSADNPFSEPATPRLWLASYSQLRRQRESLANVSFAYAILDEAQFIKNPEAKVTAACLSIRAQHRLALSGTPVENRLLDIWTIFRFLMPGLLGTRKTFERRLKTGGPEAAETVKRQVRPFLLRRLKHDVARELPEKIHNTLRCPMTERQTSAYRGLVEQARQDLGDDLEQTRRHQGMSLFALLTRLRQAACDPDLLPEQEAAFEHSGKLTVLAEKLEELLPAGEKIVVFSQFVQFLHRVRSFLSERFWEVPIFELTGETTNRAAPVREFQEQTDAAVMLVSLRAGGTGITLTNADYVFLMDPWWNPAVEEQAIDRVHRIGRAEPVFVYRMIAAGTVEERIQELKESKRELFADTVESTALGEELTRHFESLSDLAGSIGQDPEAVS